MITANPGEIYSEIHSEIHSKIHRKNPALENPGSGMAFQSKIFFLLRNNDHNHDKFNHLTHNNHDHDLILRMITIITTIFSAETFQGINHISPTFE